MASDDFTVGYRLGYGAADEIAWRRGYDACAEDNSRAWGLATATLKASPRFAELQQIRATVRRCYRDDNCSACVRRAAIERNRERYGADDYPGAVVA